MKSISVRKNLELENIHAVIGVEEPVDIFGILDCAGYVLESLLIKVRFPVLENQAGS